MLAEVSADDVAIEFTSPTPFFQEVDQAIADPAANDNRRIEPGETAEWVVTLRNLGPLAQDVQATLTSETPFVTVIEGSAGYGDMGTGDIRDNSSDPFVLEAHPLTTRGYLAPLRLRAAYAGGVHEIPIALVIDRRPFLVWDPTLHESSGPVLYGHLRGLDYSGTYTRTLATVDLNDYRTLWASMGIRGDTHTLADEGTEALAMETFLGSGGHVYLEGGDLWHEGSIAAAHDFRFWFGIGPVHDGYGDMYQCVGIEDTFTEGVLMSHHGENNSIDRLSPTGTGFAILRNNAPYYWCGIANDAQGYRTVGLSIEFRSMRDGDPPSTKAALAEAIMDFLVQDPGQSIGAPDPQTRRADLGRLAAWPTPCRQSAYIRTYQPQTGVSRLTLFDAAGRRIRDLWTERREAGCHVDLLKLTDVPPGLYLLRQSAAGSPALSSGKLLITR